MALKFSTGVPNCREGRLNPIGSVDRAWLCDVATTAEALGYHYVAAGVTEICAIFYSPGKDGALRQMELFARRVMPLLAH